MVAALSLPSWHEDQPSAEETQLAGALANSGNMTLTGQMLQAAQVDRQAQSSKYDDYFRAINALQQRNMMLQQSETASKAIDDAGNSKNPYALQMLQSNPLTAGLLGGANIGPSTQAALQREQAANFMGVGRGLLGVAASGTQLAPGVLGSMIPNADGTPSNTQQGVPAVVQAAGLNANSRVAAAGIAANSKAGSQGYQENTVQEGLNTYKTRIPLRASPGGSSVVAGGGAPMPISASASSGPTSPDTAALNAKMATLTGAARTDIQKATAANGGKPIYGKRQDGQNGIAGASGQVY